MPPCRTGLNRRHHKKTQPPVGRGRPSANNASQPDHHWPPRPPNRTDGDCFRPDRRSDVTTALATFRSRPAAGARYPLATASVVSTRRADGCFSPAMHKPSHWRLAAPAALSLLCGIGRPLRPGAIVPPWPTAL